mmetsp:Transcript_55029/g.98098  ORF Transcript_55029/g.98098 Transcript_55029/m.98098 type:complete len:82 (-) Transcript_55029:403-648(-)
MLLQMAVHMGARIASHPVMQDMPFHQQELHAKDPDVDGGRLARLPAAFWSARALAATAGTSRWPRPHQRLVRVELCPELRT